MKKIIIKIIPKNIINYLYIIENIFLRIRIGLTKDLIIEDDFGIKLILKNNDKRPIRWLIKNNYYKKELLAIKKIVKDGDLVLDIGANIGIISIFISTINKKGKIFSIEPIDSTRNSLEINKAINKSKNITILPFAVSDKNSKQKIYLYGDNSELTSLAKIKEHENMTESIINTITIEEICKKENIDQIDFLKIDTEGYEKDVIIGGLELIKKKKISKIQFEISETLLKNRDIDPKEIFNIFSEYGYKTYKFNLDKQIFEKIDYPDSNFENYYASTEELC